MFCVPKINEPYSCPYRRFLCPDTGNALDLHCCIWGDTSLSGRYEALPALKVTGINLLDASDLTSATRER